jgi:ankyrin repeat protein
MILSLVRQLLSKRPRLFRHTRQLCAFIMQRHSASVECLWALFECLLAKLGKETLLVAIRSIRECSPRHAHISIMDKLAALKEVADLDMKIITTGDKDLGDQDLGGKDLQVWSYSEDFQARRTKLNVKDDPNMTAMLKHLVLRRVSKLVKTRPAWSEMEAEITTKFWNLNPNYHWAMARVQELEKQSFTTVSTKMALGHRLNSLLLDDKKFFYYSYNNIPKSNHSWFIEVVRWITFSLRPLSSPELAVAVAFGQLDDDPEQFAPLEFREQVFSDLPGDVNRIAGYWIKVNDGKVEVTNPDLRDLCVQRYLGPKDVMHTELLERCIKYLSWIRRQRGSEGIDLHARRDLVYHLLDYAALYWPFHFAEANQMGEEFNKETTDLAMEFLSDPESLKFWSAIVMHHRRIGFCHDFSSSPLKASATFGLLPLVNHFLDDVDALDSEDKQLVIQEALDLAMEQGHLLTSRALSRKIRNLGLLPSLHKAAETGNLTLFQEFLTVKTQPQSIDALDRSGYSSLHYLAQWGKKDGVQLLLENGAIVDTVINYCNTPMLHQSTALHIACQLGYNKVAATLLAYGADPRLRTSHDYNALHLAARGGFQSLVRTLVPLCGLEEKTVRGKTPLHLAAMYGHKSICEFLIGKGASIEACDEYYQTPLHLAVREGFFDTVQVLLRAKAALLSDATVDLPVDHDGPASSPPIKEKESTSGQPGILSPLQFAAMYSHIEILKLLLRQGTPPTDEDCKRAIIQASKAGHWKSVKVLLDHINDMQYLIDDEGNSPLHLAAKEHVKLLTKLLLLKKPGRFGDEPQRDLKESQLFDTDLLNGSGLAPLHLAAKAGNPMAVDALLKHGCQVDLQAGDGDQAIHFAARFGYLAVIRVLESSNPRRDLRLEEGRHSMTPIKIAADAEMPSVVAELLRDDVANGKTVTNPDLSQLIWKDPCPLHTYIRNQNEPVARILIQKGYSVNFRDGKHLDTPLHLAVRENLHSMIRFLIDNNADLSVRNESGDNPLSLAVKLYSVELDTISVLLEASKEHINSYINSQDNDDNTPLYSACSQGSEDMARLLLQYGPDLDIRCENGWTALHIAADNSDDKGTAILEMLLEAGAKPSIKNDYQSTPIFLAAETGNVEGLKMLLDKGAVASDKNKTGSSALHRAAQNNHLDCVKALVGAGAAINLQKDNGLTPLHLAILNGNDKVVEDLLEEKAKFDLESPTFGTPLMVAVTRGKHAIAKMLIKYGASMVIDKSQSFIWSEESTLTFALGHQIPPGFAFEPSALSLALQHAISSGFKDVVSTLVSSDMDVNEVCGTYGTALQAAATRESVEVMKALLERKGKKANPNINGGIYGSALNASIVQDNLEAVKLLLKHRADPKMRPESKSNSTDRELNVDSYMEYPIHLAIKRASVSIIKELLDAGASFSDPDSQGRTVISHVIQEGIPSKIEHVLKRSDVPIQDPDLSERTPLMTAIVFGEIKIVERLLDMGADPNIPDFERKTPLIRAVAASKNGTEAIRLLLNKEKVDLSARDCRGRGALYWACLLGKLLLVQQRIIPELEKSEVLEPQFAFHAIASSRSLLLKRRLELLWSLLSSKVATDLTLPGR